MRVYRGLIAAFLFVSTFLENNVSSLRCYVCDSEKNNQTGCDNFDPTSVNFTKECPPDKSAACLAILSNGRVTSRDCESLNINDCSKANNIEYCYCSKDLCNGRWLSDADDEDDSFEGSGSFSPSTTISTATISVTTQQTRVTIVSCEPRFRHAEIRIVLFMLAAQYFIRQYYY